MRLLRDPRRFLFLFGAPLAYLLLFRIIYSTNVVREIPLAIYDAENSKLSREVVTAFSDSDSFRIVAQTASEEKMLELLREKKAFAAIEIPADFSRRIIREGSASVLYAVNGSNIIMANVTSSAVKKISPAFKGECSKDFCRKYRRLV